MSLRDMRLKAGQEKCEICSRYGQETTATQWREIDAAYGDGKVEGVVCDECAEQVDLDTRLSRIDKEKNRGVV